MDFGNENWMKPALYRDIMGAENTPMGANLGLGMNGMTGMSGMSGMTGMPGVGNLGGMTGMGNMYNTNLLGGITMQPGLTNDVYQSYLIRQQKDNNFIKKTLLLIAGMVALGSLRFKGLGKLLKAPKGLWNKITGIFKKKPATPPPAPKKSWWKFWK